MDKQRIIVSENIGTVLDEIIGECSHDKIFILTDEVTYEKCLPTVSGLKCLADAKNIVVGATDTHKSLDTLSHVWKELSDNGASRMSLLINIGGGMVTDLGGFAASTFKRGLAYINVPTTLLAMVDASVGGKTGVNFNGLKNEIGVFNNAFAVILDTGFLKTLDDRNIRSGYAEMLKHGLISSTERWAELVNFNLAAPDLKMLSRLVADSVKIKERVVEEDPYEHGIRKALNFGHTVGHAFESFALSAGCPILHGYAVAYGLVAELYLSAVKAGFPTEKMHATVQFIREYYGEFAFTCKDYESLYSLMTHDKKNMAGIINFTLLGNIGDIRINQSASKKEIFEMLDFYREG